jgi:uncharacterized protein YpmB
MILIALGVVAYFWTSEKAAQEQKQEAAEKAQEDERFEAGRKQYCEAEQKRWSIVPASQTGRGRNGDQK